MLAHLHLVATVDPNVDTSPIVQAPVYVLTFLLASVVPLIVAVLTKVDASSTVKAWANLVLSIAAAVLAYLIAHDGTATIMQLATVAITAYLSSGVTYSHFWKPTGVAPTIAAKTANVGIGKPAAAA